ncbi:MAG: aminotransferase class V-fold PLP-dependent enzyme, partial [Candidatus Hydrogenedentes bacterium]|nr:aminotransferase class V-fold PLP-dependent enzyme [Candidatus Hydrogenedentota bacterium]
EAAKWGAQAHLGEVGKLPVAFPRAMGPNALKYVQEVVESGLTCDMMGRFEKAFAEALGVKHCIGTPGCTPALHVLALACGFEPGDEIIVSPVTDYGTVQGWIAEGVIPVFADTEPGTINFCPETIAACITDRTRAILCVHMTGLMNDMDGINALAKKHGLLVFEDACQSVFGEYKGRVAGTLADAACFSFDSEKTMGSDVGGCLVTNDSALYERARYMGQSRGAVMQPHFGRLHADVGYAYRMPGCTAAICLAQLEIVREQVAHRDAMVRALYRKLAEIPGITPLPIPEYTTLYSCWMPGFNIDRGMFTCSTESFASQLAEAGIPGAGMGEYYLMPAALTCLHKKVAEGRYPYSIPPASRKHTYSSESCPVAAKFLKTFIRWSTFCEKYQSEHVHLAAQLVAEVADRNRV